MRWSERRTWRGGHPDEPEDETGDLHVFLGESIPGPALSTVPEGNEQPKPVLEAGPVDE